MTREQALDRLLDRHFNYLARIYISQIIYVYVLAVWIVLCSAYPYVGIIESVIIFILIWRKKNNNKL